MIPQAELEAADRALCEFEEARQAPCITAASWGLGFTFDRQGKAVSSVPSLSGASLAASPGLNNARVIACASPVATPPAVSSSGQPAANSFPPDVRVPAGGVVCVWCALERMLSGQGSAPRINGDVRTGSCPRHAERPDGSVELARPAVNPNAGVVACFPKGRWS